MAKKYQKTGWARTKKKPHANHPALYRKTKQDDIEYVTFTHSENVDFDGEKVKTLKLKTSINKTKEPNDYSRVVPRVYEGKRSALGKGTNQYRVHQDDRDLIDGVFSKAPRYTVSGKKISKKKKP